MGAELMVEAWGPSGIRRAYSAREAIRAALKDFQGTSTWERIKNEPLRLISLSDLATDLAPLLQARLEATKET